MPSDLSPSQRREARLALAMLPVGAVVLVGSALGFVAVLAFAAYRLAVGSWTPATLAWCGLAAAAAVSNMRAGIAIMSALDWRPVPLALAVSAGVLATWRLLA